MPHTYISGEAYLAAGRARQGLPLSVFISRTVLTAIAEEEICKDFVYLHLARNCRKKLVQVIGDQVREHGRPNIRLARLIIGKYLQLAENAPPEFRKCLQDDIQQMKSWRDERQLMFLLRRKLKNMLRERDEQAIIAVSTTA
jgi:hypothetical protein